MKCCAFSRQWARLALLTRHTPKDIADERERFQEMLELHQQFSEEAQQKMLGYVHELESTALWASRRNRSRS